MKRTEISTSYKETSAPPNSSKKRKSTSDVWNHFKKETDQNGMVWAKCQHCGKRFSGLSKDGTTHLKNHLNSSKCKRSQKEMICSSETGGLENPTVTNGNFVFDEERSGFDLVRMIIKNGHPLDMVEDEDFKMFVKNLQPTIKLPSQDALKDKILCFYREEKEKLLKQFDKLLSFSLILNFWTDCGKMNKYCSFSLQFIEDGPKLKQKIIAMKNVEYDYTGETLFEIVKGVLLEWNIDKKLASITVERSSANDVMVKRLDSWLDDQGNCHPFREKIFLIPCITHVLNVLVKDGLDEIDYILQRIRKAIEYMRETTIGERKFEEVVKKLNLGGKDVTSEGFFGSKCLGTIVYFSEMFNIVNLDQWGIAEKMKVNLDKFFDKLIFVSAIVAAFDPRKKMDFVEFSYKKFFGDNYHTMTENARGDITYVYAEYLRSQGSSSSCFNNDNSSSSDGDDPCNMLDILDEWKKSKMQNQNLNYI
ncbi:hypothetical protein SO802_022039 [Lithocarpus litseifolius]|uniref:BED-type domain-containing protein n=1 Tax=Lithocarpus litseifolius TaxID=425828 RepID=A0AAW2CIL5_9ROSI